MDEILQVFRAALAAVDPFRLVSRSLRRQELQLTCAPYSFDLDRFSSLLVVGAGKAAAGMGLALEGILGDRISRGLLALPPGKRAPFSLLSQIQTAHPLPDSESERAASKMLALLAEADERTLVLCLLSGGASALLAAPAPGVTLDDKRAASERLLQAGASIDELNTVRRHLSAVKGGRLAAAAYPATLLTLSLSDVVGDVPEVIGSGPTVADPSTFAAALTAIDKYGLAERMPRRALFFLQQGAAGMAEETVKPGDPRLARTAYRLIGSNADALEAARKEAEGLGWRAEIAATPVQGEAQAAGRRLAREARQMLGKMAPGERRCLLSGGETTVTVRGRGRGGRNQELALAFALEIAGSRGIEMLSAGTDGVDGPTDAAGAIVDGATVASAARSGLDAEAFLGNNDSYAFFAELDRHAGSRCHLKTGLTGTNVLDLQVIRVARTC